MTSYWIVGFLWACGVLPLIIAALACYSYMVTKAVLIIVWIFVAVMALNYWEYAGFVNADYTNHWYWKWVAIINIFAFLVALPRGWETPVKEAPASTSPKGRNDG